MSKNNDHEEFADLPIRSREHVELAHGSGGELMREIITQVFAAGLADKKLELERDSAIIHVPPTGRLAFATDSFVVTPLFFPGGDIGSLAVNSTLNDLAMVGARPLYLSVAFILEEGLPLITLDKIVASMRTAAKDADVHIVTGDTKVVDRGSGDGVFINTTGIGIIESDIELGPKSIRSGDAVLVNGDLGRHGTAVLSVREGLAFQSKLESDCVALHGLVSKLIESGIQIHFMRDLTRGGLASALVETARASNRDIEIDEDMIPISDEVESACRLVQMDPLYVANEGRMVLFVKAEDAERAVDTMRAHPHGRGARIIGTVRESGKQVRIRTPIGTMRQLDRSSNEKLPRVS